MENFFFKEVKISCCNLRNAVDATISRTKINEPHYICVTDVCNVMNACRKSPELKKSINNSFLSIPDGRPLSVFARMIGMKNTARVAGPDFMEEMFKRTSNSHIKHFFIGDTDDIHSKLKRKISENYDIRIAGFYSPPFTQLTEEENMKIIEEINSLHADLIWVSLGGGKQEIWMEKNFRKLNSGIMIGIGAAFRFYLGEIKRAPLFFQQLGFEWFFRLMQQPVKMFKRYATTLPFFIMYSSEEFLKKSSNKNKIA